MLFKLARVPVNREEQSEGKASPTGRGANPRKIHVVQVRRDGGTSCPGTNRIAEVERALVHGGCKVGCVICSIDHRDPFALRREQR
jgi:hypothetical protein